MAKKTNVGGDWEPGDDRSLESRDWEKRANHQLLDEAPFSVRPGPSVAGWFHIPLGAPSPPTSLATQDSQ